MSLAAFPIGFSCHGTLRGRNSLPVLSGLLAVSPFLISPGSPDNTTCWEVFFRTGGTFSPPPPPPTLPHIAPWSLSWSRPDSLFNTLTAEQLFFSFFADIVPQAPIMVYSISLVPLSSTFLRHFTPMRTSPYPVPIFHLPCYLPSPHCTRPWTFTSTPYIAFLTCRTCRRSSPFLPLSQSGFSQQADSSFSDLPFLESFRETLGLSFSL